MDALVRRIPAGHDVDVPQAHASRTRRKRKFWLEHAIKYTKPLEPRKHDREVHDLGFLFLSTYYRWHRLTHEPALRDVLIEAGRTLALRFQEKGQYLRSFVADNSLFIDIMMNVGIIFYAARETGDRRLRDIAIRHSLTTRRVLVRGDGSTAHEGIFDTDTGEFLRQTTHQGYRGDSCWSRGSTWALYGFTTCYEYSRDPQVSGNGAILRRILHHAQPHRRHSAVGFQRAGGEPDAARHLRGGDLRGGAAAAVPAGAGFADGAPVLVDGGADSCGRCARSTGQARIRSGKGFCAAACTTCTRDWAWTRASPGANISSARRWSGCCGDQPVPSVNTGLNTSTPSGGSVMRMLAGRLWLWISSASADPPLPTFDPPNIAASVLNTSR